MSPKKSQSPAPTTENYYLAKPKAGKGPGVLVLPAWWGLTSFFRELCDRLAAAGFVALAPDLYHGQTAATIKEAEKLRGKLKRDIVAQEIAGAAEQLRAASGAKKRGLGVVGFSLGGYWSLWLAEQASIPVAATVAFYGTRTGSYTKSQSAFQFHFAETDNYVSASGIKNLQKSLKAAGREAEFYTYPGTTHWFFENNQPAAYNAPAAQAAWTRTIEFLGEHLP
jgi:carboxymethylenebutenolidase